MAGKNPIGYRASAVPVGTKVDLSDHDPNEKGGWDRAEARQQLQAN